MVLNKSNKKPNTYEDAKVTEHKHNVQNKYEEAKMKQHNHNVLKMADTRYEV